MKLFLFTLLLTLAGYGLWDYGIEPALFDDSPRALTLSNLEGKELEVTLFERDATHVHFRRADDPTLYRYPIEQLSYLSRCKVWLFPKAPPSKKQQQSSGASDDALAQTHLDAMIQKHDALSEQITLLSHKRDSTVSRSEQSALHGEIKLLKGKADALAHKIEDLKYRYPDLQHSGRRFRATNKETSETGTDKLALPFGVNDWIGR